MEIAITADLLINLGLDEKSAQDFIDQIKAQLKIAITAEEAWEAISKNILANRYSFPIHLLIFSALFPNWHEHPELAPAWLPPVDVMANANISKFMDELEIADVKEFHKWSCQNWQDFWTKIIKKLNIIFKKTPEKICDLSKGVEFPNWLPQAKINIIDSCFNSPEISPVLIYYEKNTIHKMSYGELNQLTNCIANSLLAQGFVAGDAIAIIMPMNQYAVAIYLAIIKMGGVVISIADSFSSEEISLRLKLAKAKGVFTQDIIPWGGKNLPLYEKIKQAGAPKTIVLDYAQLPSLSLRNKDVLWSNFFINNSNFDTVPRDPMAACNILFSSGTTGEPKAIAWDHTTAIKAASDAYFHQNIQPNDVLAWPTNLGWMMGPWLIFAALINQASIALYPDVPKDSQFGKFIQDAKVTMLGVVPTLVSAWRQSHCMENLNWNAIKVFSSTGECSNAEDMLYLMSLAGYKPVIEYCGGTEIGGAYVSSTVVENNYPALFSTPTMGLNFIILDEMGKPAHEGEVAIQSPSMGLSTYLLNADHHKIYYADMPKTKEGNLLRRHGDQIKQFENGYYIILGRVDDTMNLGGIKISAAEIERSLIGIEDILETAAIAINSLGGPSQLVIYVATYKDLNSTSIQKEMQTRINQHLNPLFKIHDVVLVKELPKTASNKIMRRILRKKYLEKV